MNITDHIHRLLSMHNELTIPFFGTIYAEKKQCTIHPTQHSFSPPFKHFYFIADPHKYIRLLIEETAEKESISIEAATEKVNAFTEQIKTSLNDTGAFVLAGVGRFYIDVEKKLCFNPANEKNFLLSSFGLPAFTSAPVLRRENISNYATAAPKKEKLRRRINWFKF